MEYQGSGSHRTLELRSTNSVKKKKKNRNLCSFVYIVVQFRVLELSVKGQACWLKTTNFLISLLALRYYTVGSLCQSIWN